jgi:hypothetical protein
MTLDIAQSCMYPLQWLAACVTIAGRRGTLEVIGDRLRLVTDARRTAYAKL